MAEIILVNIPSADGKKPYDKAFRFSKTMNFGLLSIATYLQSQGITARLLDLCASDREDQLGQVTAVIKCENPSAIGLSCISGFAYPSLMRIAKGIRRLFPDLTIIVGGKDHIGLMPETVLSECDVDIVVRGEGEIATFDVMKAIANGNSIHKIPNISYRYENQLITHTPADQFRKLEGVPSLDYALYPDSSTFPPSIEVSRGCSYSCNFCVSKRERIRKKAVAAIVSDAINISHLYQIDDPSIYFETPMFSFSNAEIGELLELRKNSGVSFNWRTETRVEYLATHSVEQLALAGLRVVDLGLESASPEMLVRMNKTSNPTSYLKSAAEVLKSTYDNGIITKINIMFYIGENRKTLRETIDFLNNMGPYVQSVSAYPFILCPNIRSNQNIMSQIVNHGGSLVEGDGWENRHLSALNPSRDFTYTDLQYIGKLIAKSYQSINTFFEQKRFGYLDPNVSFSTFREKVEGFGIENLPFFLDEIEANSAKSEIMDIVL